jgi:hypothetical protein
MTATDADQYRAAGIWPARPMTALGPLPALRSPRRSRVRRALALTGRVIVVLVVLSGVAYALAAATRQLYMLVRAAGF